MTKRKKRAFTLAEGATHVDNSNNKRKFAFTLAEVLITLGIIGVVAALTIPNLIQNYQKKQWVAGLQKGYATLNQVFKTAMAEDMVDDVTQTELWQSIPVNEYGNRDFAPGKDYSSFVEYLKKYLKVTKFCNPTGDPLNDPCFGISYVNLDGSEQDELYIKAIRLKIYTADGMVYYLRELRDVNMKAFGGMLSGSIDIDINGDAGPNQIGRDFFPVILLKNGSVIFPGTKVWAEIPEDIMGGTMHWSNSDSYSHCLVNIESDAYYLGDYCGARIFENGWKMDY